MNNLASLYMTNCQLRPQQHPIDLLEQAVSLGYSRAFLNLAICFEKGKMVQVDRARSLELLRLGAEKGDL
jgi:TPR repeat protein